MRVLNQLEWLFNKWKQLVMHLPKILLREQWWEKNKTPSCLFPNDFKLLDKFITFIPPAHKNYLLN